MKNKNKLTVVYYTSTSFLDVIIETIQSIKQQVNLHVIIEIAPSSKKSTIIEVDSLENMNHIEQPERLLGKEKWEELKPYFNEVKTVEFVVHKNKKAFSPASLQTAFKLGRYLKKYKADILHFDSISTRALGLCFYARSKKTFITIHDPAAHSGEHSWREKIPKKIFFPLAKGFFVYSAFAAKQFKENYGDIKKPLYTIKLQPYTFFSKFLSSDNNQGDYILFFGRLSYYKGIDILLEAIPKVLKKYPKEKFIIAGSPSFGYQINKTMIEKYPNNINLIEDYISTEQLVKLIEASKFVVCPYRDATQSGVVMTTFAAGKMVIGTHVGSFSEYIREGQNGLLTDPNSNALAEKIFTALDGEYFKKIEQHIIPSYNKETGAANRACILEAYER